MASSLTIRDYFGFFRIGLAMFSMLGGESSMALADCPDDIYRSEMKGPISEQQLDLFRAFYATLENSETNTQCQAETGSLQAKVQEALEKANASIIEITKAIGNPVSSSFCASATHAEAKLRADFQSYLKERGAPASSIEAVQEMDDDLLGKMVNVMASARNKSTSPDPGAVAWKSVESDQLAIKKVQQVGAPVFLKFVEDNLDRINQLKRHYRAQGILFGFNDSGNLVVETRLKNEKDSWAHATFSACSNKPNLEIEYEPTDHIFNKFPYPPPKPWQFGYSPDRPDFATLKLYPCFDPKNKQSLVTLQDLITAFHAPPTQSADSLMRLRDNWASDMFPVLSSYGSNGSFSGTVDKEGDRYEGAVKNGRAEGRGRFTLSSGAVLEGTFQFGFMREGSIRTESGSVYSGGVEQIDQEGVFDGNTFVADGKGHLETSGGIIEDGDFKSGKLMDGTYQGPTTIPGIFYEGKVVNGVPSGGKFTDAHGQPALQDATPELVNWYYRALATDPTFPKPR